MYPFLLIYKSIITPEHPKHSNTYAGSHGHTHVHTCTHRGTHVHVLTHTLTHMHMFTDAHTLDDLVFPRVTVSRKKGRKARAGGRKSLLYPESSADTQHQVTCSRESSWFLMVSRHLSSTEETQCGWTTN